MAFSQSRRRGGVIVISTVASGERPAPQPMAKKLHGRPTRQERGGSRPAAQLCQAGRATFFVVVLFFYCYYYYYCYSQQSATVIAEIAPFLAERSVCSLGL